MQCPRASKCSFVDIVFGYLNGARQSGVKMRSLIRRHGYHWPGIAKSFLLTFYAKTWIHSKDPSHLRASHS